MPYPVRPSLTLIACSILILSHCADQTIIQQVQVIQSSAPNPIAPTSSPSLTPNPVRTSPSPVATAAIPPSISASPASPSETIQILPISGPDAGTVDYKTEFEKFADSIPEPSVTKDFTPRHFDLILAYWQARYEKVKHQPYGVLKMYMDAGLIAPYNENLTARLNEAILYSGIAQLLKDYTLKDAKALASSKAYTIRSYFRGTRLSDQYRIPDWQTRLVNVVQKESQRQFRELNPEDVNALAPKDLRDGTIYRLQLYSSARDNSVELSLIYKRGGWQIDYWTPNVLALFMP